MGQLAFLKVWEPTVKFGINALVVAHAKGVRKPFTKNTPEEGHK
jgi:hypothetical protein